LTDPQKKAKIYFKWPIGFDLGGDPFSLDTEIFKAEFQFGSAR
jgi:hypothetical protein